MKSLYSFLPLFAFVFLLSSLSLSASNKQDFTQTIKKEFEINPEGLTNISNSFGRVDIQAWDQSRVRIEVTITVRAISESEAQRVFDRIQIDFSAQADEVSAITNIQTSSGWFSRGSKGDFTIDYKVHIPRAGSIRVDNKYGDLYAAPFLGNAEVRVKYGNFQLDGVGKDLQADLTYGNGTVVKVRDAQLQLAYSKMQIDDARNLVLVSKYSKTTLLRGATVRAESKYDNLSIGKVRELRYEGNYNNLSVEEAETVHLQSKYTDIRVDRLSDRGLFEMQYGGARLHVLQGFAELNLEGRYTNFKLSIDEAASYQLHASGNYAGISYPRTLTVELQTEEGSHQAVEAFIGTRQARSVIRASLSYGGLKIN